MTNEEHTKLLREENEKLRAALHESKTNNKSDAFGGMAGLNDLMKNFIPKIEALKNNAMNQNKEVNVSDGIHGGLIKLMADGTILISCTEQSGKKYFKELTKKK